MISADGRCGRMSLNDPEDTSLFSMDDMFARARRRDITEAADARFFIPIPRGSQVSKANCCIVGGQGCGKTEFEKSRVAKAYGRYGRENVHTIYTDDIRVALDLIDDAPVQYVVIDDAMTNASSRQVYAQVDIIKTYNRSRHVFEEKLRGSPGLILYDWAWQRYGELDPSFRQSDITLFKTGIAEPSEQKLIEAFLGPWYKKVLWQIWDTMNQGNNDVKSLAVGSIASLDRALGVGIYRSEMTDIPLPPMVTHGDHFDDASEAERILDAYRGKPLWDRRIECYELSLQGMTQIEIAAKLGTRQGWVSESVRKVRELIGKK